MSVHIALSKSKKQVKELEQELLLLRNEARSLCHMVERVRRDITDQDTGWYYQLGNCLEKVNRLLSK
jgi:hypothetical protein